MKSRTEVPRLIAAELLFRSDHTCCVCRRPGVAVQLHHLDEHPTNHDPSNLAVLCLEDHNRTHLKGGFGRHLSREEIQVFRDDWEARISARREHSDEVSRRLVGHQGPPAGAPQSAFLNRIPGLRADLRTESAKGWSGSTADMMNASYDYINAMLGVLLALSGHYPPGHFSGVSPAEFFSTLISTRFEWHRAHL